MPYAAVHCAPGGDHAGLGGLQTLQAGVPMHGAGSQPQQTLPALMLSWLTRTQATLLWAISFSQKVLFPLPGGPLSSSKTGTPAFAFSSTASTADNASGADGANASVPIVVGNVALAAVDASAAAAVTSGDRGTAFGVAIAGDVGFIAEDASVAAVAGSDSVSASLSIFAGTVISSAEDAFVSASVMLTRSAGACGAACMSECEVWLVSCVL